MNPKSIRRLSILFGAVAVIVAIGFGLYAMNEHRKAERLAAARAAGLAAFRDGDHVAALENLKLYVARYKADPEALYAYGTARSRIEEPNGKHVLEGIGIFRVLLELQPDHAEAKKALLELYPKAGYLAEAIELADAVLKDDPTNVTALRARAIALNRQRKFEEAAAAFERLNEVAPHDLSGQLATYRVYKRINKRPAEIIARAEAQRAAHPDDPRFELLLAVAHGEAGDGKKARELLKQAAGRTPPDAQFVRELSAILDQSRMFDESRALLERAVATTPGDAEVLRVLVRRLWQNGRSDEVVQRLEKLDPVDPKADTELLALKAMSLFELNRGDEARPAVAALAARKADAPAIAWATALEARFGSTPPLEPKAAIARFQAALARDPDNAVIRFWVGESYDRLGESEPAIEAWKKSAEQAPSWPKPPDRIARALAATGRAREAVEYARRARAAAPDRVYTAVTYAVVWYLSLDLAAAQDTRALKPLLELVTAIQQQVPGEPETLSIYVLLLARTGERDRAEAVARAALTKQPPLPQSALLRLRGVVLAEKLSRELALEIDYHAGRVSDRLTPALALSRATELAHAGRPGDGLAMLETAAKSAATAAATQPATAPAESPLQWELAIAQYREYTKDPAAPATWAALGDARPGDLQVQTAVLKLAGSARADRAFIERTIDRVRKLTGDEGTLWKVERAKWLLGSDQQKDHSEAVAMLTDIVKASPTLVEPRLLLAAALEKVDNLEGAIKEFQQAADLDSSNPNIPLELARLLQAQGRWADARLALNQVVRAAEPGEDMPAATRRHVAAMYAAGGDAAKAIELLAAASTAGELDTSGELLLAELYRRQGRPADADTVYKRLLDRPAVEAEVIAAAADFFGAQGRAQDAHDALARLDTVGQLRPGVRERIRAAFEEKHGSPAAGTRLYRAATTAAPADADAWRELVSHLLRTRKPAEALAAADEAVAAVPNNDRLQTLRLYAATAAQAGEAASASSAVDGVDLQPLIDELARDPGNARSAAAAQVLQDERSGKLTAEQAAERFRQLADRNPRYKPVQVELVRRYLALGRLNDAVQVATRTMEAFPTDSDAARLAVAVLRRAGQWERMQTAARQWRQRSLERPLEADWAIAEARRNLGDVAGGIAQIAPHVETATRNPERLAPVLQTAARLYAAAGRDQEARDLLAPLLKDAPQWRAAWLTIARTDVRAADAAFAWVEQVAPLVPADAPLERLALAGTWHAIGVKFGAVKAWDEARAIATSLAAQGGAGGADAAFLLASIEDASGRPKEAEANYRRALAANPDHAEALNNLAYLLAMRGTPQQASEARDLAARAVAVAPAVASFRDTLARAHLRAGEREQALEQFVKALELDPVSLEALIGKATALSSLGKQTEVRELIRRIDILLKTRPPLPEDLKRELDATRASANAA